jgi:paraquat-inducible protein B
MTTKNRDASLDESRPEPSPDALPDALVEQRRGLSLVWLIPVVAALIGGWLAYKTLSEKGPLITLTFKEGTGLEAGKTHLRHKALDVGLVKRVQFSDDLSHVVVTAELAKNVESHLGANTKFWVVRPRVGLGGVSGLETVVSGSYIEVDFGDGEATRAFTGLERPPDVKKDTPGREYSLSTTALGGLQDGSPISFRGIPVGEVLNHKLAENNEELVLHVFVRAPYHELVRDNSRFWKTGGFDVSVGAQGINVKMNSLLSFLAGGIAFDTPDLESAPARASPEGSRFDLFDSFEQVTDSSFTRKHPYILYFDGSVRGLSPGAPVEFHGIKIGSVTDIRLEYDAGTEKLRIPVIVNIEPERVVFDGGREAASVATAAADKPRHPLERLIARGLRAQLKTGSLLTGQLFVDLDFYPNSPAYRPKPDGAYPEIPTVPSTLEAFQSTAAELLAEVMKLPFDQIGKELLGVAEGSNRLVNAPEIRAAVASLNATLKDVQKLSGSLERQVVAVGTGTDKTLVAARDVLEAAEPGSPLLVDLANTLEELAAAARSIRAFTDYLERHPEALLYGKSGPKPR